MYLDIGLCLFLVVCMILGWFKGFMCGIVGFISGALSFVAAMFTAKPLAKLLGNFHPKPKYI